MSVSRISRDLELDENSPSGEFYWNISPEVNTTNTASNAPQSKFELLVWLGLMPDNNILSNKLIKVLGKHVFELISKKAAYKSYFSVLQKYRENVHVLFDPIEQQELWHCWRLIAKLRALQEIDYLFNRADLTAAEINEQITNAQNALAGLYPLSEFPTGSQENIEWQTIEKTLNKLSKDLQSAKNTADRNELLQQWQQKVFRYLSANFQISQGQLSTIKHDIIPRENWENTTVTQELENSLQNWEFGESSLIKDSMLYRNEKGSVLYSGTYPEVNKRDLLFTAQMAEVLGPNLGLDANNCLSVNTMNNKNKQEQYLLHQIKDSNDDMKRKIKNETIAIKKRQKNSPKDKNELQTSSNLLEEWWEQWKTHDERENDLSAALLNIKTQDFTSPNNSQDLPLVKYTSNTLETEKKPLSMAEGVKNGTYSLTAPAEKNFIFSPGDSITAALKFFYEFTLYFDQMMGKHPFVATSSFTIPYLQFGGIGLSIIGNNALLGLANLLASTESKILVGKLTAAQINAFVKIVDEGILWFTLAESPLQVLVTCGFTFSKLSYSIVDILVNDFLSKTDQTTLSELAKKLDPTGSLEGYTTAETAKSYLANTLSGLLLLIIAAGVGVGANISQFAILEFLAHVPLSAITNPSIQTFGAIKASGILIGKLTGINNFIAKEELIDTNGCCITAQSKSYEVLKLFVQLNTQIKQLQLGQKNTPEFKKIRDHFEKLLQLNPQLLGFFDKKQLKDLGVTLRSSSWYHRLPVAFLKSLFYAAMFAPAILAHCYYAAIKKPIPPMWKLALIIPLNWVILTGKIGWTSFKALTHGFLQVIARLPEIAIQSIFVASRFVFATIGKNFTLSIGFIAKGCGYLFRKNWCPDPSKTSAAIFFDKRIGDNLKQAQIFIVTWVRINIRYRLEKTLGTSLKLARDYLVRKGEQWLQRTLTPFSTIKKTHLSLASEKQQSSTALVKELLKNILAEHRKNKNDTTSIPCNITTSPTTSTIPFSQAPINTNNTTQMSYKPNYNIT